jgi:hypothetical protein
LIHRVVHMCCTAVAVLFEALLNLVLTLVAAKSDY